MSGAFPAAPFLLYLPIGILPLTLRCLKPLVFDNQRSFYLPGRFQAIWEQSHHHSNVIGPFTFFFGDHHIKKRAIGEGPMALFQEKINVLSDLELIGHTKTKGNIIHREIPILLSIQDTIGVTVKCCVNVDLGILHGEIK